MLESERNSRIARVVARRQTARKAKDFERSDNLRLALNRSFVGVMDQADGSVRIRVYDYRGLPDVLARQS